MRIFKIPAALLLVVVPLLMPRDVSATDVSIGFTVRSVNDFYEPLSTEGYWVQVEPYGRCWHPSYVASYWRPYCDGIWVWTDDGWYWDSDEPWAWATYHYGRWAYDPYYGWVWVPGTVWGPSWVVFRVGGGYCGWAPLPPGPVFGPGGEIVIGVGLVPETWFVFVGERHFGERHRYRDVIIHNTKIINRTKIDTRIRREGNRVFTEGPRFQDLERINRVQIRRSTVSDLREHERIPPAFRRTVPHQPASQRQNERQFEQPPKAIPQGEQPHNKPPEIIRGTPGTPGPKSPPVQQQERRQPPVEHNVPASPLPEQRQHIDQQHNAPSPQNQQHIEQHPNTPPPNRPPSHEKAAPAPQPKHEAPPSQENGRDRGDHGGQDDQGGHGR